MIEKTVLARVRIAGGGADAGAPVFVAELRSFNREKEDGGDQDKLVVRRVFGLRTLAVDAAPDAGGFHKPLLVTVFLRPKEYPGNDGVTLSLRTKAEDFIGGTLEQSEQVQSIVATPLGDWAEATGGDISVPPLRLVEGGIQLTLLGGDLKTFLSFEKTSGKATLFGKLFVVDLTPKGGITLRLTPSGIEIAGSLPDPTRDLPGSGGASARIKGVFRLEGIADPDGRDTQYVLRLIRGDGSEMDLLEGRIASAFSRLSAEEGSPFAIRYDSGRRRRR